MIRVQITHFEGRRERRPASDLDYTLNNPDASVWRDDNHAWLKTDDLSVCIPVQDEWHFTFQRAGQTIIWSEARAVGLFEREGKTYIREQLSLDVGETIYGLGERFGPFVKNGQTIEMWNEDGGTMSEHAYKNVPFYVSSAGYGVLVNHPGRVSFDVASQPCTV